MQDVEKSLSAKDTQNYQLNRIYFWLILVFEKKGFFFISGRIASIDNKIRICLFFNDDKIN
jgi:hypothetical protein